MIILVGLEIGFICLAYSKGDQLGERLNYTLHHADTVESYRASWDLLQTNVRWS